MRVPLGLTRLAPMQMVELHRGDIIVSLLLFAPIASFYRARRSRRRVSPRIRQQHQRSSPESSNGRVVEREAGVRMVIANEVEAMVSNGGGDGGDGDGSLVSDGNLDDFSACPLPSSSTFLPACPLDGLEHWIVKLKLRNPAYACKQLAAKPER